MQRTNYMVGNMQRQTGTSKSAEPRKETEAPTELENQFILRLPLEPAESLRAALRSGTMNVKDRLSIRLEPDMRHGVVRFDNWTMSAKVVDLPTIVESLKSINNKSFYKTADVSKLMICKEEEDHTSTDEEVTNKKNKDPTKPDKKYLWLHGITPPLKNVRRKRFRRTLKKKYVEAPEIEKEVKRLLRVDNEAANIKWEVLNDEEGEKVGKVGAVNSDFSSAGNLRTSSPAISGVYSNPMNTDIGEYDIFGAPLSDSEDEGHNINIMESEEEFSRLSGEDSHLSDSLNSSNTQDPGRKEMVTEFSTDMFPAGEEISPKVETAPQSPEIKPECLSPELDIYKQEIKTENADDPLVLKLETLQQQLAEIRSCRQAQEAEISTIENVALRQRFQTSLDNLIMEQQQKEQEYNSVLQLLSLQQPEG